MFPFALSQNEYAWNLLVLVTSDWEELCLLKDGDGHHHLLIDTTLPNLKSPIPADSKHIHFGKGQTETSITLEKGEHQLTLVMGNFAHIPHDEPIISETITVIVK